MKYIANFKAMPAKIEEKEKKMLTDIKLSTVKNVAANCGVSLQQALTLLRNKNLEICPECKLETLATSYGKDCLIYDCLNCWYQSQ